MRGQQIVAAILGAARGTGHRLDPEQAAAMGEHYALLQRWNRAVSLTAVRDPVAAAALYTEPLSVLDLLPAEPGGRIVDVGSGGGFPGLILALLRPAWSVLLVERAARKSAFLAEAVRLLGLRNAEILERDLRSAGDLPVEWSFDALTLKAVGAIDLALSLLDDRGRPGSIAVLFTGREGAAEVQLDLPRFGGRLQPPEIRLLAGRSRAFAVVVRKAGQ